MILFSSGTLTFEGLKTEIEDFFTAKNFRKDMYPLSQMLPLDISEVEKSQMRIELMLRLIPLIQQFFG
jgi:hypothetical protein